MILTRRFGALRARPVFPAVTEHDERLEYFDDVHLLEESQYDEKVRDSGESAA